MKSLKSWYHYFVVSLCIVAENMVKNRKTERHTHTDKQSTVTLAAHAHQELTTSCAPDNRREIRTSIHPTVRWGGFQCTGFPNNLCR